jgi:hypothetical protein
MMLVRLEFLRVRSCKKVLSNENAAEFAAVPVFNVADPNMDENGFEVLKIYGIGFKTTMGSYVLPKREFVIQLFTNGLQWKFLCHSDLEVMVPIDKKIASLSKDLSATCFCLFL